MEYLIKLGLKKKDFALMANQTLSALIEKGMFEDDGSRIDPVNCCELYAESAKQITYELLRQVSSNI
jgi:hypothetical protein